MIDMVMDEKNKEYFITDIEYDGTSTFTVGIYVNCEGANNGAWAKIDDALLNSQA